MTEATRRKYQEILAAPAAGADISTCLAKLRSLVVAEGLGVEPEDLALRGQVWKVFLGVNEIDTKAYLDLLARGPSSDAGVILIDAERTFKGVAEFQQKVPELRLQRLLNAFVHQINTEPSETTYSAVALRWVFGRSQTPSLTCKSYVQGMNTLVAPFAFVLGEAEAFYCFHHLLATRCPKYFEPGLVGVHSAVKIFDECLEVLDHELWSHLKTANSAPESYAFASLLSLCACTPPLRELLRLWDVLLAMGPHLNVLFLVAQLILMRSELLAQPRPWRELRQLPPLDAGKILPLALSFAGRLPPDLYTRLVEHTGGASL